MADDQFKPDKLGFKPDVDAGFKPDALGFQPDDVGFKADTPATPPQKPQSFFERHNLLREAALGLLGNVLPESEHPIRDLASGAMRSLTDPKELALSASGIGPLVHSAQTLYGLGRDAFSGDSERMAHAGGQAAGLGIMGATAAPEAAEAGIRGIGRGIESTGSFVKNPAVGVATGGAIGTLRGNPFQDAYIGGRLSPWIGKGMEAVGRKLGDVGIERDAMGVPINLKGLPDMIPPREPGVTTPFERARAEQANPTPQPAPKPREPLWQRAGIQGGVEIPPEAPLSEALPRSAAMDPAAVEATRQRTLNARIGQERPTPPPLPTREPLWQQANAQAGSTEPIEVRSGPHTYRVQVQPSPTSPVTEVPVRSPETAAEQFEATQAKFGRATEMRSRTVEPPPQPPTPREEELRNFEAFQKNPAYEKYRTPQSYLRPSALSASSTNLTPEMRAQAMKELATMLERESPAKATTQLPSGQQLSSTAEVDPYTKAEEFAGKVSKAQAMREYARKKAQR